MHENREQNSRFRGCKGLTGKAGIHSIIYGFSKTENSNPKKTNKTQLPELTYHKPNPDLIHKCCCLAFQHLDFEFIWNLDPYHREIVNFVHDFYESKPNC